MNGIIDDKTEVELHSENISTKVHNIKEEPVEVSDTKTSTATSEPSSETLCSSVKSEKVEEVKRNSAEEIQQTLKNDQQAKIPLKKRGMKFSEDFEKNSGIIVQNPPASQVKDISKSDMAPEQTKNALNDHVNGDVQPALEKDLQSHLSEPLKDTCVYKEQKSERDTGKSAVVRENELPSTDKEGLKDRKDKDCSAEKLSEVVPSHQADSDKRDLDMQEKEPTTGTENREHNSPLSPKAESTPLPKDVNNALEESSNHKKHEKLTEKPADAEESCSGDKATTNESDNLPLNHEVTPKETESKESEKKTGCVDKDTSESSSMEETKTSKTLESVSDMKQIEVCNTDAKDTAIPEMNVEKSNNSESKEEPVVINTTEIQSADKDPAKKMDDSGNKSPSSTKTREILADGDNAVMKESNEISNTKEPVELFVVEKVNKSESFKPAEKQCNINDSEITPTKNSAASETNTEKMENTEGTKKPEHTKKSVIWEDNTIHNVTTISDSTPRPMEVEAVAVKQDLTKPQEDDKIEMNSVEHKTTVETSEEKDKPFRLVEKTEGSEETDKESNKGEENVSEEQHSKTETEQPSSEMKEDPDTVSKKDTDSEKCTKDNEEHLCQEKESHQDSSTENPSATEKNKTSTIMEESGQKSVSKESDTKPSSETEKPGQPSKEPETDKSTDEDSKSKSEEQDSTTIKEVANGVEAPANVRVEGGCRKIKPPAHRRKAELQREERQGDSESDTNTGRSLRRSPRISRPTPKAVEIHDRKTEKPQPAPPAEKHERDKDEKDDEEEEVVVKAVQKKPREKKPDQEGQPKPKVRLLTRRSQLCFLKHLL